MKNLILVIFISLVSFNLQAQNKEIVFQDDDNTISQKFENKTSKKRKRLENKLFKQKENLKRTEGELKKILTGNSKDKLGKREAYLNSLKCTLECKINELQEKIERISKTKKMVTSLPQ